jgi:hypothetical protein
MSSPTREDPGQLGGRRLRNNTSKRRLAALPSVRWQ